MVSGQLVNYIITTLPSVKVLVYRAPACDTMGYRYVVSFLNTQLLYILNFMDIRLSVYLMICAWVDILSVPYVTQGYVLGMTIPVDNGIKFFEGNKITSKAYGHM